MASGGTACSRIAAGFAAALVLVTATFAHAAPEVELACQPLAEPEFREMVAKAKTFIVQDRPTSHAAIADELEERIPCLTFVPSPDVWAGYLVGLAAVRYLQNGDWKGPLAAAIRVVPNIDRGVNANHEMGLWTPPPEPPSPGPVPEGVSLFVDGVLEPDLPAANGLHLVQVRTWGGELYSALVRDQPVPTTWFARRKGGGGTKGGDPRWVGSAVGGVGRFSQAVDAPGDYVGDSTAMGPAVGGSMVFRVGQPVGVAVDALGTTAPHGVDVDGSLLVTAGIPQVTVGLGAAVATADRVENGDVVRSIHVVPTLGVAGRFGPEDGTAVDAGIAAGFLPSFTRGVVRVGVSPPGGTVRFRGGVVGRLRSAHFVQIDSGRRLAATDLSVVVEVGVVVGSW